MSTAPELAKRLETLAAMIELGEKISWGSDSALMREAAGALAALPREAPVAAGYVEFNYARKLSTSRVATIYADRSQPTDILLYASPANEAGAAPVAVKALADAEASIMQEYRWGNLTKLGVANHLRRAGFNLHTAAEKANAIEPATASPASHGVVDALDQDERMMLGWMLAAFEASKVGQKITDDLKREMRAANRLVGRLSRVAALAPDLAEGVDMVLVPKEPTREMLKAAFDTLELNPPFGGFKNGTEARTAIYRAMLAAAPEQEKSNG